MSTLDPRCEAWVQRVVERAPELSEKQKDTISAAFDGAIQKPAK